MRAHFGLPSVQAGKIIDIVLDDDVKSSENSPTTLSL